MRAWSQGLIVLVVAWVLAAAGRPEPADAVMQARYWLQRKEPVKALNALRQAGLADPSRTVPPAHPAVLALASAGAGELGLSQRAWEVVRKQVDIPPLAQLAVETRFLEVCQAPCGIKPRPVDQIMDAPLPLQAGYLRAWAQQDAASAAGLAHALLERGAFMNESLPAPERAELVRSIYQALEGAGDQAGMAASILAAWKWLPAEPALGFLLRAVDERQMMRKWGTGHALVRLDGLAAARRNREVIALGTSLCGGAVLKGGGVCPALDAAPGCQVAFAVGKAQRQVRKHDVAERVLTAVASRCPLWAERALFLGARAAIAQLDGGGRALPLLERLARHHPASNLADDALVLAGETAARMGRPEAAAAYWQRVVDDFPQADMAGQAAWWLAWMDVEAGRIPQARVRMERIRTSSLGRDAAQWRRAAYWYARLDPDPAAVIGGLEEVVRREPLSFEAALARGFLRRQGTGVPAPPVRAAADEPAPAARLEGAAEAGWALARLGMDRDAAVLMRAWIQTPRPTSEADLVVARVLVDVGAASHASLWLRKHRALDLQGVPQSSTLQTWKLAYPHAHGEAIEAAAASAGLPRALLFALAREESAFDAEVTSLSGAVGLFQLVPPTALTEALTLKLPVENEAALRDPALNARLGASYLARNARQFRGNLALAVAAYNAGPGMVHKWFTRNPEERLDFFIERIPIAETRDYVKRVLESYSVYSWQQDGLPMELPERAADRMVAP